METLKKANGLLIRIGIRQRHLAELNQAVETRLQEIRSIYSANIQEDKAELEMLEKDLIALMKANKAALFDDTDQVNLEAGILLRGEEEKVKIPRNALELIEREGWDEAIKVAKTVDREVVEGWPDERLVIIGAERKPVVEYGYEVRARNDILTGQL